VKAAQILLRRREYRTRSPARTKELLALGTKELLALGTKELLAAGTKELVRASSVPQPGEASQP
jgi:hypothetical protein